MLDIDRDRQRISLGLKQTQEDPWQRVVDTYNVGDELEGTVTKVVAFGAFVEILEGVEGLVHISELASHHVENPREVVTPGDDVRVKILEIDSERRRLSLSVKRVEGQILPRREVSASELADAGDLDDMPELGLSEDVFTERPIDDPDAPDVEAAVVAEEAADTDTPVGDAEAPAEASIEFEADAPPEPPAAEKAEAEAPAEASVEAPAEAEAEAEAPAADAPAEAEEAPAADAPAEPEAEAPAAEAEAPAEPEAEAPAADAEAPAEPEAEAPAADAEAPADDAPAAEAPAEAEAPEADAPAPDEPVEDEQSS